ncbi:MAG: glycosyltransferase family 2 protein, partial [Planctomycetota bacterium]
LWFVVADQEDPAYEKLCELKNRLSHDCLAKDIKICVAGQARSCSQKIHNLLHCYKNISDNTKVLAFADADICVRIDWLSHLVYPLHKSKNGCASGYRWFVPKTNNIATIALSTINGKVAMLLGNTHFNQVWGGSMAIKTETFQRLGIEKIWQKALSDDLSISYAVKKAKLKVAFVPACLVASYESTTWQKLFEFGRRQFLITRIYMPKTWWFGLISCLFSTTGLWATVVLAILAQLTADKNVYLYTWVPILFFANQAYRALLRQKMISKVLKKDVPQMKPVIAADIFFSWLWSLIMLIFILSSAFGRTITWRGIKYKLISPTETIIINSNQHEKV